MTTKTTAHLLACLALLASGASVASAQQSESQTDWSGGAGAAGPVGEWGTSFDTSSSVAWLSVPGRLSLASVALPEAVASLIADDAGLPPQVSAGDIDGDGDDDVVSVDPLTEAFSQRGAIYWWERLDNGSWDRHTVTNNFYGAYFSRVEDVDLDGDPDVVAAAYYGVVNPPPPPPSTRNGRFAWFENLDGRGGRWRPHSVGELFWGANWVDVGDLDGDGDIDMVGASQLTDGVYEKDADLVWFENLDGKGGSWREESLDDNFPNASEAHVADFDRDGDLDILGTNQPSLGSSTLYWWENEGNAASFAKHQIPGSFSGVGYADVGDLDADGDLDIMGGGLLGNSTFVWENLDNGARWGFRSAKPVGPGRVLELVDVEGDGDLDALVATGISTNGGGAWWIENLSGNGRVWQVRQIDFLLESRPWIASADVDGDGKLEAIVSDEAPSFPRTEQLQSFDLTSFESAGQLVSSILDGGSSAAWGIADWGAEVDAGADLTVEVRASSDASNLGSFVTVPDPGTDLASLIDPQARYLQYRLQLSGDGSTSPVVTDIGVDALYLEGPSPGVAGELNSLFATWKSQGTTVLFVRSPSSGLREIPRCPGVYVNLGEPRLIGSADTSATGTASIQFNVPAEASGKDHWFQAVELDTCTVSRPLRVTFQ